MAIIALAHAFEGVAVLVGSCVLLLTHNLNTSTTEDALMLLRFVSTGRLPDGLDLLL